MTASPHVAPPDAPSTQVDATLHATPPEPLPDGRLVSRLDNIVAKYSPDEHALYVRFAPGTIYATFDLLDTCNLDYTEEGIIVGVEFLATDEGVSLGSIPRPREVAALLRAFGIPIKEA